MLGVNVIAINRNGTTILAPGSNEILGVNDQLIVSGNREEIIKIGGQELFIVEEQDIPIQRILSDEISLAELEIIYGDQFSDANRRTGGLPQEVWCQRAGCR